MRLARPRTLAATALLVTTLAACGSSGSDSAGAAGASGGTTTLKLGAVPTIDLGLIGLGEKQGFFSAAGLKIDVTNVDAGPTAVTGVVAGQYDLAYAAYAPPLLALGGGAPLRAVANTGVIGAIGTNSGVLVKKSSGITTFAGLAGKRIGSNAARSLLSLTIPAAVQAAGADASKVQIVPLPFTQLAEQVERGQIDASGIIEPYQTKALAQYPDLVNIGDSYSVLTEGAPGGVFFTSAKTQSAKSKAISAFAAALAKTETYANAHLDEVRAQGATLAGLSAADAAKIPVGPYQPGVTAAALQPYAQLMVAQGWLKTAPDLAAFTAGTNP